LICFFDLKVIAQENIFCPAPDRRVAGGRRQEIRKFAGRAGLPGRRAPGRHFLTTWQAHARQAPGMIFTYPGGRLPGVSHYFTNK